MLEGGYCVEWNAWRVWLHPRRALDIIDESVIREMDLEKRLAEALDMLEEQRRQCVRLTADMAELSSRLTEKEDHLVKLTRELDRVRDELAEHESIDRKLEEFDKALSKVEKMKSGYEKRISILEARLRDANHLVKNATNADMYGDIDMLAEVLPAGEKRIPNADEQPVAVQKLPAAEEKTKDVAKPRPRKEKPAPGLPDKFPKSSGPDDWLLTLPEGL